MYMFTAVLFTFFCWIAGFIFFLNFGISFPQYGTKKFKRLYSVFFITGLVVLFVGLPLASILLAM